MAQQKSWTGGCGSHNHHDSIGHDCLHNACHRSEDVEIENWRRRLADWIGIGK